MQNNKPRVNFWATLGCITAMLRVCREVLPDKKYSEMRERVEKTTSYTEQKRIIERYVEPYILPPPEVFGIR